MVELSRPEGEPLALCSWLASVEDLLAEDVRVAGALDELAEHVQVHPPQGPRSAPVDMGGS
jgi:hypothetical protein